MTEKLISEFINRIADLDGATVIQSIINDDCEINFFIVGGAIRNHLINPHLPLKDIDIFYQGPLSSKSLNTLAKHGNISATPFGSIRWYPKNSNIYYDLVEFTEVHLINRENNTIQEILRQFDITTNAIAINPILKKHYNPIDGEQDILRKIVRAVRFDFSDSPISNDCPISLLTTLWFRTIHFASLLEFEIEPVTKGWIIKNMFRMEHIKVFEKYFFSPKLKVLDEFE